MQNLKFNLVDDLLPLYRVYISFFTYYQGRLPEAVSAWRILIQDHRVQTICDHPDFWRGVELLRRNEFKTSPEDIFEFNRLFIGPDKLVAPPYEGAYRNQDSLIMQDETLAVRHFYEKVGLSVRDKHAIPDDRLEFELEFVCYLLSRAGKLQEEQREIQSQVFLDVYREFYLEHLRNWTAKHCQDIIANAQSGICRALALIMLGFLSNEEKRLVV